MTLSDAIFEEMMKNPDDLDLFLELHLGFGRFYQKICVEFFNDVLARVLEQKINAYNVERPGRNLILRKPGVPESCLEGGEKGCLLLSSDFWPNYYTVIFGGEKQDFRDMFAKLSFSAPERLPSEIGDVLRAKFKDIAYSQWYSYNDNSAWFYFLPPLQALNVHSGGSEVIKNVLTEVMAGRQSAPSPSGALAGRYAESLMDLVNVIDDLNAK